MNLPNLIHTDNKITSPPKNLFLSFFFAELELENIFKKKLFLEKMEKSNFPYPPSFTNTTTATGPLPNFFK